MAGNNRFRRLRGALGNALIWGVGWSIFGLATFTILRLTGIIPESIVWAEGLLIAVKMGIIGFVAGGAFSSVIRLVYHGKRLSDISWVRFGIGGGIAAGVFVPLFLQTMNVLSGDGMVPWGLVLDDGIWAAVFGAAAAGGMLKLAQRAGTALPPGSQDQPDALESGDNT